MEALVPAFIAALLAHLGDRPARLAAIRSERYGAPLAVAFAAMLALAAGNAVAGFAAMEVGPSLTPNAQGLLVAVALLYAGGSGLMPPGRIDRGTSRLGAFLGTLATIFAAGFGDRSQFLAFAIGSGGNPWFAAAGSAAGGGAIGFIAAVLGESAWSRLPLRAIRIGTALLFLVAAGVTGVQALRLV